MIGSERQDDFNIDEWRGSLREPKEKCDRKAAEMGLHALFDSSLAFVYVDQEYQGGLLGKFFVGRFSDDGNIEFAPHEIKFPVNNIGDLLSIVEAVQVLHDAYDRSLSNGGDSFVRFLKGVVDGDDYRKLTIFVIPPQEENASLIEGARND